jgi:DTW domain-containing protein
VERESDSLMTATIIEPPRWIPLDLSWDGASFSPVPTDALEPGRKLWVLHPSGDQLPEPPAIGGSALQQIPAVLLLDGSWRQAGEMLASVHGRGRLPAAATSKPSRYWLRDQAKPEQLCTAEGLMGVLKAVGEPEAAQHLRLPCELHVYATLLVRGRRELAERYLGHSPLLTETTDALERLHAQRGA